MNALERLEELLNQKDRQIEALSDEIGRLKHELDGSLNGWRETTEVGASELPVPRLELVYMQNTDSWDSYRVVYRLVYRHLLDHLVGLPLGQTRVDGGFRSSAPKGLPFRDGAHARHDAKHLRLPLYKIMPGREPRSAVAILITPDDLGQDL